MKHLLLFLFASLSTFSQEVNIAKDTLELKQVVIKENLKNFKSYRKKINGDCTHPETLADFTEVVTLADNLQQGYLESVTFFINEMHYNSYKKDSKGFDDTEFEVVLYKVAPNGTPGARLLGEEKYIKVMKIHTGEVIVHFLEFNLKNPSKMFIGLRRTAPVDGTDFYIDCLCNNSSLISFIRNESDEWQKKPKCAGLKMEINVLVKK